MSNSGDTTGQSMQNQYSNNGNNSSTNNNHGMGNNNTTPMGNSAPSNAMNNFANTNQSNANNANNNNPNNNNANNNNANAATNNNANAATNNNANAAMNNNANAAANNNNGDNKSIMQQVASQEKRITELNKQLTDRNQTLQKFQTEKKTEMEALMAGMKQWIGNLDVKNEGHKDEFEKGLQRLVDTSSFDNGVWQVMVSASACAAKKEEDYQSLKTQFEELNQKKSGGVFGNEDERVGGKRAADGEPEQDNGAIPDLWSSFISDVGVSGYPMY
jgi:uncharacterized coiled-coil protein SlyX